MKKYIKSTIALKDYKPIYVISVECRNLVIVRYAHLSGRVQSSTEEEDTLGQRQRRVLVDVRRHRHVSVGVINSERLSVADVHHTCNMTSHISILNVLQKSATNCVHETQSVHRSSLIYDVATYR